jgi:hypothetical protein
MVGCRVFGHRYAFRTEGSTMLWECDRCGYRGGWKSYATPAAAQHYAAAFDRRDTDDLGKRAPWLGMFPLRIWRYFARRH